MTYFDVVSIGNELLSGRTTNTNLQTICKHLDNIGCQVLKAYVIRDKLNEISSILDLCRSSDADWIIMSGGLGPTYDDITLESVSFTLNLPLKINQIALKMIVQRYNILVEQKIIKNFILTESRKKMANLPIGSIPLKNRIGTAPGVLIKHNRKNIICLPGVPKEMEDILINEVLPLLDKTQLHKSKQKTLSIKYVSESELAPIINDLSLSDEEVYIKSHPRGINEGIYDIEIIISVRSATESESIVKLNSITDTLISSIKNLNGIIIDQ